MVSLRPATLYLIRHGESEGNVRDDLWEWTDCSLTARGRAQMERLADRLRTEPLDVIYSSTMRRARESAEILAASTRAPIIYVDWLREMNFGDLDLMTMDEVNRIYPGLWERPLTSWEDGYPNGETVRTFYDRVTTGVKSLLADPHGPAHMALLGHGGSLEMVLMFLLDMTVFPLWRFDIGNGSLSIIHIKQVIQDVHPVLALLNDTSHWRLAGI